MTTSDPAPAPSPAIGTPRDGAFIAWIYVSSRSRGLAKALGIEPYLHEWAVARQPKLQKIKGWFKSGWETWTTVRRQPSGALVVVMVPPIWAPMIAIAARPKGVRLAIDMHSGARDGPKWAWSWPLLQWLMRTHLDAVVVTNTEILDGGNIGNCRMVVIVDPTLATIEGEIAPSEPTLPAYGVFPASGDHDEPIDELADAADLLGDEVIIKVTGRPPERVAGRRLELMGFLTNDEYMANLEGASFVLALTTAPATNQRAASEAVQRGTPIVCSDTKMLRVTYEGAAEFVDNTPESMAAGIRNLLAHREERAGEVPAVADRLRAQARAGVKELTDL